MTEVGELTVTIGGKDIGLAALLDRVDKEMQQSADQAVKLGQSYARLAQAQGQPAAASQILAGTMQRAGGASEKALIGIETQAARLTNTSQGLGSAIGQLGGQLGQLGGTAGSLASSIGGLAGSFGAIGVVGAAVGIGKIAVDLGVAGANAELVRQRFDDLAESAGTTGDALLIAMRAASGGEISDLNLQLAANRAQLLGVADSAEEFSVLMGIARDRAQQMGISTTQAFNDLVTGLGRGSALILDNLGITVSVTEANNAYAASIGKTASQLTEAEQKQALMNAVLAQGKASLDATGGAVDGNASAFARAGTQIENAKNALGTFIAGGLAPIANQIASTGEATQALIGWFQQLGASSTDSANAAAAHVDIEAQRANVLASEAAMVAAATQAQIGYANALEQTGVQARAAAAAAQMKADADQLASVDAQTHAVAQKALADQARIAAQALLASGGSGASAAAALAGSSQQVDVLTAAYYRLAAAQAAAGQAATKAKLEKQTPRQLIGADSEEAGIRDQQRQASRDLRDQRIKDAAAAARAEEQYQRTLGNTGPALSHAQAELKQLTVGTAAYINKQIEIARLQDETDRNAKKGKGRGGAGGVKLSDQQKLNNSLLADQDKYEQKSEDQATQHAINVEQINQRFYEQMRAAQQEFDQSLLDSRAGFYDQMGSIESAKIQQASSAAYEAASVEAGKIAQEKGADVADKYMQAQEQVILARAKRQADIEKAVKDKDKGRAEYLRGVDAQYRAAEDAKLARIKEGGDSLAAERDKQLAEEDAKFADSQDKNALASERSADRRVTAAERAGKAIDAEQAKLTGLEATYNRIGAARGVGAPGAAAAPVTAPAVAAAAPAAVATAAAAPTLADLITQLMSKLDGMSAAIVEAEKRGADQVSGAVKSIRGAIV